jgi:hypothetical protein
MIILNRRIGGSKMVRADLAAAGAAFAGSPFTAAVAGR